jgi:hypothetical protein
MRHLLLLVIIWVFNFIAHLSVLSLDYYFPILPNYFVISFSLLFDLLLLVFRKIIDSFCILMHIYLACFILYFELFHAVFLTLE